MPLMTRRSSAPLDAPYIRRQVRFDAIPLLIAQPKQVPAHDPDPLPKTNQNRIVRPEKLMSSDPRSSRKDLSSRLSPAPVPNTGWHLNPGGSATGVFCSLVPKRHAVAAPGVASYIGREHGHEPSVYPLANHGLPDGSAGSFLGHRYSKISLRFSSNSALSISPFANRSFKISMKRSRGPPALRRHALSDGRSTLACSSLPFSDGNYIPFPPIPKRTFARTS